MKIAEIDLPYIWHWTDKLGRHRYRFRRRGFPGVELPVDSDPASPEFQAAYHAALRGEEVADALAAVAARGGSGTIGAAVEHYLNSTTFLDGYSPSTQALRRPILKSFLQPGIGNLPLAKMDRGYIERWLETSATMVAKRTRLLAIKPFFAWAIDPMHLIASDPTKDIKVKAELKVKEFEGQHYTGHYTWTNEQIAKYCACYPLGTMERLAIELMLDLATRRGDAIVLGRQHVKQMVINGVLQTCLVYTQQKNRKRKPVTLTVPISPELSAAIEAYPGPETSLTFLTNKWGRPFTDSSFNDWFRERVAAAGLPDICVPHGLRKASSCIMAENDCTVHQIAAKTGHRSLKEIQRYTDGANQPRLAAPPRPRSRRRGSGPRRRATWFRSRHRRNAGHESNAEVSPLDSW